MIQLKLLSAGLLVLGICQANATTYETNFSKFAGYTLGTILADSGYDSSTPADTDPNVKKKNPDGSDSAEDDDDKDSEED